MHHSFGLFHWRADGLYRRQDAVKTWKREYEAITYTVRHPGQWAIRRMGLLGK